MAPSHCHFPVVKSILDPQALLSLIASDYDIDIPGECKLWRPSCNDTYIIKTNDNTYILRIYQAWARTQAEIHYELDLLNYLDRKRIPVAVPIERSDGTFVLTLNALEGVRYGVLFTCAEGGDVPFPIDETYSLLYGRALAELHTSLDGFSSQYERHPLDFDRLLDRRLQVLLPQLSKRPDDVAYLRRLVEALKTRLMDLPITELDYGVCHGDAHEGNAYVTENQKVTFFDFDDCGLGWRAYDLATFRWNLLLNEQDERVWQAFLQGYQQKRTIREKDLSAVPLFVVVREIWIAGQLVSNVGQWGFGFVDDRFFDDELGLLKKRSTDLGL